MPSTDPPGIRAALPAREPEDFSLRFIAGIGPARAQALAAAGLRTAWDVIHAVPRLLPPPPPMVESGPLEPGALARVRARVLRVRPIFRRGRGMSVEAMLERADGYPLKAMFFNAGWLKRHLLPNEWYLWEGRADEKRAGVLNHPSFTHMASGLATPGPVDERPRVAYRPPAGISERAFEQLVENVLIEHVPRLADPLGELAPAAYQLLILSLHHPADAAAHEQAARGLARRELRALAWLLQSRRARQLSEPGRAWTWSDDIDRRARARLPFTLTAGQDEALAAIRADMRAPEPMCRLLQGDVGSGKTALALIACLAVIAEGAQALMMAPTAILAEQHHAFFARCLAGSRVRLRLLTAASTAVERSAIIADLAAGRLDVLIGTHALLEDDVRPLALGLVVIDEQHKFGVAQRAALVAHRGPAQPWRPDLLLLTATPIPRTLALTVFGDLAVSRIAGRPPGRGEVTTECQRLEATAQLDAPLRAALASGGRAFVICPFKTRAQETSQDTGDDAGDDVARAWTAEAVLAHIAGVFPGEAALVHGDLRDDEKTAAMRAFATGVARILVATTVVEVGIDVPEATLLAVLDAERFGLAQLHQLRGRIGRGPGGGRCILFHRGELPSPRLLALSASDDGLAIAEADLAARGPGELLGTGQHGAFILRAADLARDLDLLQDAHEAVRAAIARHEPMPPGLRPFLADDQLPEGASSDLLAGG